ncbi:hypothetical protein J2W35_000562 [Variovorax boronicumulans]|uniref:hypothetical protein n=1 Tax=Variovorax boronicumulans TaxID=436515 RepID=UPI0027873850|nr:hypothetical protein [Variovorax boronicumulans]MDQ0080234.1 hypothetical protein [Variovorax boronicumulans]
MTGVLIAAVLALATCVVPAHAADDRNAQPATLVIKEQGSLVVGGTVIRSPGAEGQTLRGDHARVFYQVPLDARKLLLVMWQGFGQFGKTWETTADGREGCQTIFLRRGFPVYLVDQPRRGGAVRCGAKHGRHDHQRGTGRPALVQHVPLGPLARFLRGRAVLARS